MKYYYYDDDCDADHFQDKEFSSDDEAIAWALSLKEKYNPGNCLVYTEESASNFRTVKSWE